MFIAQVYNKFKQHKLEKKTRIDALSSHKTCTIICKNKVLQHESSVRCASNSFIFSEPVSCWISYFLILGQRCLLFSFSFYGSIDICVTRCILLLLIIVNAYFIVCSGSIVATTGPQWTADSEVPGSSPEWVPIFYEARSTAQHKAYPSLHPFGVVHLCQSSWT